MPQKFLYRRWGLGVIAVVSLLVGTAVAQGRPQLKRPEDVPEEKPPATKKPKKGEEPRAVGLLQIASSGKVTLIPLAIRIDGKFYDASAYKADPVPMALEGGTIYEAERAGSSQGLFTVNGALHSKNPNSEHPWVGTGSYLPQGAEAPKTTRKAEDLPVGMDSSGDEPPRLSRGKGTKPAEPSNPTPAPASSPSGGTGSSDKSGTSAPSAPPPVSNGPAAKTSGHDEGKPVGAPLPGNGTESAAKDQAAPEQSGNYYRPTLRRGKPTQSAPQEDETELKPGKVESPAEAAAATQEPVQLVPAISDADGPEMRSYAYFWKEGEEDERRKQMLALAENDLRAYVNARAKGAISAKPPAAKTGLPAHKAAIKPAQPVFDKLEFRSFDVWGNNQPVMILTAEAHFPTASGAEIGGTPESYSLALVARTDIYGNIRKLYSGVTDKFHLDVTPRLALIDAVDADGDGRGELLFRETTDAGNGYVIYRPTADKLWKMFDSLNGGQ